MDDYIIEQELGNGILGKSYLASSKKNKGQEKVVFKILEETAYLPSLLELLENYQKLSLPHTLLILQVKMSPERVPFLVREYGKGKSLSQIFAAGKKFSPQEAYHLFIKILRALIPLHSQNMPHGSLRPENIILSEDQTIFLADGGITDIVLDINPDAYMVYTMGKVIGRNLIQPFRYFSPSRQQGKKATIKDDVFSLGVLMHHLFTGEVPLDNAPSQFCGKLELALEKVLMRMVGDVSRRYNHSGEILVELQALEKTLGFDVLEDTQKLLPGLIPLKEGEGMATTKIHLAAPVTTFTETTKLGFSRDDLDIPDIDELPELVDDDKIEAIEEVEVVEEAEEIEEAEEVVLDPELFPLEVEEAEEVLEDGEDIATASTPQDEYSSEIITSSLLEDSDILAMQKNLEEKNILAQAEEMSSSLMEGFKIGDGEEDLMKIELAQKNLSEETDILHSFQDYSLDGGSQTDPALDLGITDDIELEEFEVPSLDDLPDLMVEPEEMQPEKPPKIPLEEKEEVFELDEDEMLSMALDEDEDY
ncbi:MAG: hypothetical protein D6785_03800, partial [Planctomycetota bacterium]